MFFPKVCNLNPPPPSLLHPLFPIIRQKRILLVYPAAKFYKTYCHSGLTNIIQVGHANFTDKSFYFTNSFLASKKARLIYKDK